MNTFWGPNFSQLFPKSSFESISITGYEWQKFRSLGGNPTEKPTSEPYQIMYLY